MKVFPTEMYNKLRRFYGEETIDISQKSPFLKWRQSEIWSQKIVFGSKNFSWITMKNSFPVGENV